MRLALQGEANTLIVEILGVSRRTVGLWLRLYAAACSRALQAKRRVRKVGEQRTPTLAQEAEAQRCVVNKTPDQVRLPFALWSWQAVRGVLRVRFGIVMPIRTAGEYLRRWGVTAQKPIHRTHKQNPTAVQRGLTETYSTIVARSKQQGGEIH